MCSEVEYSMEEIEENNEVEENEIDDSLIFNYAFCGIDEDIEKRLNYLSIIAEKENWTIKKEKPFSILRFYLIETFAQCYKQNKVIESADGNWSCFNTGLLTNNGNDIIGLFEKNRNPDRQPWVLKGFFDKCAREILDFFSGVPELATFWDDDQSLTYNSKSNLVLNLDHSGIQNVIVTKSEYSYRVSDNR